MKSRDLDQYLEIAIQASNLGKIKLLNSLNESKKIDSSIDRDIKLKGDKQSEQAIIEYLQKKSNFSILSEEIGQIDLNKSNNFRWIIDPLDGTLNFFRGIPISCISIALWDNEKPVFGVISDFNRNELFSGIVGKGAWLNGQKIRLSNISSKEKAVLCTGFPINTDFSEQGIRSFVDSIRSYKKVRWIGSAALSLAYVACGRVDAYYEKDIMLWDVAAGLAIVSGAGGKIEYKKGKKENSFNVNASNNNI